MLQLCVFVGSQVDGQLTVTPNNTAVIFNDTKPAVLRCHAESSSGARIISWNHIVTTGTNDKSSLVVFGCTVEPGFSSSYNVTRNDDTGQCDLVVSSSNTSLAGLYKCVEATTGDNAQAYVTIIGQ